LSGIADAADSYFREVSSRGKPSQKEVDNQVLTPLQATFADIRTAREQGKIDDRQAKVRMKTAYTSFVDRNPGWSDQATDLYRVETGMEPTDTGWQLNNKLVVEQITKFGQTPEGALAVAQAQHMFPGNMESQGAHVRNKMVEKAHTDASIQASVAQAALRNANTENKKYKAEQEINAALPYVQIASRKIVDQLADVAEGIQSLQNPIDALKGVQLIDELLANIDSEIEILDINYGWSANAPEKLEAVREASTGSLVALRTMFKDVLGGDTGLPALKKAIESQDGVTLSQVIRDAGYYPRGTDAEVLNQIIELSGSDKKVNLSASPKEQRELWQKLMEGSDPETFNTARSITTKLSLAIDEAILNPQSLPAFVDGLNSLVNNSVVKAAESESIRNVVTNASTVVDSLVTAMDEEGFVMGGREAEDQFFSEQMLATVTEMAKLAETGDPSAAAFLDKTAKTQATITASQQNAVTKRLNGAQDSIQFSWDEKGNLTATASLAVSAYLKSIGLKPTVENIANYKKRSLDNANSGLFDQSYGESMIPSHLETASSLLNSSDIKGWRSSVAKGISFRKKFDNRRTLNTPSEPATPSKPVTTEGTKERTPNVFKSIVDVVFAEEGGYVDDKDDRGGKTKYGITQKTYPDLDIENLSRSDALELLRADFYIKPKIDRLPEPIQEIVFDGAVNTGQVRSIMHLQQAINNVTGKSIDVDGINGPDTQKAAKEAWAEAGEELIWEIARIRRDYYKEIAPQRKNIKYFRTNAGGKGGWVKRIEKYLPPDERWSEDEFGSILAEIQNT
jgi:lysozyme family protein